MRGSHRLTIVSLWAALVSLAGCAAEELPQDPGHASPDDVFAAYKQATNNRDWRKLFSLGTTAHQDQEILELALLATTSNDEALRAIATKHGVDLRQLSQDVEDAVAAEEGEIEQEQRSRWIRIREHTAHRIARKAGFFAAAHECVYVGQDTVREMRKLVKNDLTASGEAVISRPVTETVHANPPYEVIREVIEKKQLHFRRIDGKWYLALDDEAD